MNLVCNNCGFKYFSFISYSSCPRCMSEDVEEEQMSIESFDYETEGYLYLELNKIIVSYEKNGALDRKGIVKILELLLKERTMNGKCICPECENNIFYVVEYKADSKHTSVCLVCTKCDICYTVMDYKDEGLTTNLICKQYIQGERRMCGDTQKIIECVNELTDIADSLVGCTIDFYSNSRELIRIKELARVIKQHTKETEQ